MTQIEAKFIRDGATYGYSHAAGTKGMVYANDIPFLIANGVIEEMQVMSVDGEETYKPKKKSLWRKIFG